MATTFIVPFACAPQQTSNKTRSHKTRLRIARGRDGGVGTTVALNRLIFHPSEVTPEISTITLQPDDYRAAHIIKVLRLPPQGGTIRAAVIDGLMYDDAHVTILPNNSVSVSLSSSFIYKPPPPPQVSLILALPRPKVLARLLPQIAAIGVSHLVLCNAYKVERCYFDSALLRDAHERDQHLIEGISQCGVDNRLPKISVEKRLKVFLEDRLTQISPPNSHRILAHPETPNNTLVLHSLQSTASTTNTSQTPHVTLAIGPEGGWMPRELSMLQQTFGFKPVSLGPRILRTDAAVLVLLGLIHEFINQQQQSHKGK